MARPTGPALRQPRRRLFRPFRTRRRFGWGWIRRLPLLWIAALAICVALTYYFAGSGVFRVRTVQAGNVSAKDLAAIRQRCGCIGDNIFVVRPDDIKRRLQTIPTLDVVRVYTRLPNKVFVDARPKQRVAIWRTPEAAYAVDAAGEVLQVWKKPIPHRWGALPIFDEGYGGGFTKGHRLLVGQYLPKDDPLSFVLSLRAQMPADLQALIKKYVYRRFIGMIVEGKTGWWALFSPDDGQTGLRIQALQGALLPTDGSAVILKPGYCINLRGPLNSRGYQYYRQDHNCGI
jgi:hypothetical protein